MRGRAVSGGGVPVELLIQKLAAIRSLLHRTAELMQGLPLRVHGAPAQDIQAQCRPWLFQPPPGNDRFAFAMEEPGQRDLFADQASTSADIIITLLFILRAIADDSQPTLAALVPEARYQRVFLQLTRQLAPLGKAFAEIEIWHSTNPDKVVLVPSVRASIGRALRHLPPLLAAPETTLRGSLHAVHADQDWIDLRVDGEHVRIDDLGEIVDDVIGPLVGGPVIVDAVGDARGWLHLRDIQADE